MFTKTPFSTPTNPVTKVFEDTVETLVEIEGTVEVRTHILKKVDVSDDDLKKTMPSPEEYSLENRLRAGVGLDEVDTQVLTPTGVISVNEIAEKVIATIEGSQSNEN